MIGTVAVSLGVGGFARRWVDPGIVVCCGLLAVTAPVLTAATALLAVAVARFRAASRARVELDREADAALETAELIALGLAGGLSVAAAHRTALDHAPASVQPALASLVATMGHVGVTDALTTDEGAMSGSSAVLVAASSSGAPVLAALQAHVSREHHRRHMEAVERARRLPIRLLIPLTLLVLPGFVLITVGPTVVDSLARLVP